VSDVEVALRRYETGVGVKEAKGHSGRLWNCAFVATNQRRQPTAASCRVALP
jgi:hypothetical protein